MYRIKGPKQFGIKNLPEIAIYCRTCLDCILKQIVWRAGLVLKVFLALLPKLLAFMNTKQGISSHSGNDFGVVKKYFIFQVS